MKLLDLSKNNKNTTTKEEIKDWIIKSLVETYKYPNEWVDTKIVTIDRNDFYGIHILTDDLYPFIIISINVSKITGAIEQDIKNEFSKFPSSCLGMITDGTNIGTRVIKRKPNSNNFEYVPDIESYKSKTSEQSTLFNPKMIDFNCNISQITLTEKAESVFFDSHSYLRDIDGLHADEALDEVCKIILTKLYDEKSNKETGYKLQVGLYGNSEELAVNIRNIYKNAVDELLKNTKTSENMGVFQNDIKLSSAALVKVVSLLEKFNISDSDIDIKGRAFQKVLTPAMRAGMGQYFTPLPIINLMVEIVQPTLKEKMLDPFCGSGHFLSTTFDYVRKSVNSSESKSLEFNKNFATSKLNGIEKSERMVRIAMTDMLLHEDGSSQIRCSDALLDFRNYSDLSEESFDLILTNPPFGSILGAESIMSLGKFNLASGYKNIPLEVLGLERCLQFLRPGGRLGIVLPDGLLANPRSQYIRENIESQAKVRAIIGLPIETFSPFGANIKTSIVFLKKRDIGEIEEENYNIFIADIHNVGYDATGKTIDKSEIKDVIKEATSFFKKEGW